MMERKEEGLPASRLKDEADAAGWEQEPPPQPDLAVEHFLDSLLCLLIYSSCLW